MTYWLQDLQFQQVFQAPCLDNNCHVWRHPYPSHVYVFMALFYKSQGWYPSSGPDLQVCCFLADTQPASLYIGTHSLAPTQHDGTCQVWWFTVPMFTPVSIRHMLSLLTYRCGSCTQELEVFWGGPDFIQGHMGAWSTRRRSVPHRLDQEGREQLQICTFTTLLFVSRLNKHFFLTMKNILII